jgi:hypothetical protein
VSLGEIQDSYSFAFAFASLFPFLALVHLAPIFVESGGRERTCYGMVIVSSMWDGVGRKRARTRGRWFKDPLWVFLSRDLPHFPCLPRPFPFPRKKKLGTRVARGVDDKDKTTQDTTHHLSL